MISFKNAKSYKKQYINTTNTKNFKIKNALK